MQFAHLGAFWTLNWKRNLCRKQAREAHQEIKLARTTSDCLNQHLKVLKKFSHKWVSTHTCPYFQGIIQKVRSLPLSKIQTAHWKDQIPPQINCRRVCWPRKPSSQYTCLKCRYHCNKKPWKAWKTQGWCSTKEMNFVGSLPQVGGRFCLSEAKVLDWLASPKKPHNGVNQRRNTVRPLLKNLSGVKVRHAFATDLSGQHILMCVNQRVNTLLPQSGDKVINFVDISIIKNPRCNFNSLPHDTQP